MDRNSQFLGYGQVQLIPYGEKGHQFESNSIKPTLDTHHDMHTCKRIGQCLHKVKFNLQQNNAGPHSGRSESELMPGQS